MGAVAYSVDGQILESPTRRDNSIIKLVAECRLERRLLAYEAKRKTSLLSRFKNGTGTRTRTANILLWRQALYQLSYAGM